MPSDQRFGNHTQVDWIHGGNLWNKTYKYKVDRDLQRYPRNGDRQGQKAFSKHKRTGKAQRANHIYRFVVPFESHTINAHNIPSVEGTWILVTWRIHKNRGQHVSQHCVDFDGYVWETDGQTVLEKSNGWNGWVSVSVERFQTTR